MSKKMKQRLIGLVLGVAGIIVPTTASVLIVPLGLYLLFTKQNAIY